MSADLSGLRVLVTRPQGQDGALLALLKQRGAITQSLPLLEIVPTADPDAAKQDLERARQWDAWIFTSRNAARIAAELDEGRWPPLFAVGPGTAKELARHGRTDARIPEQGASSQALLSMNALGAMQGKHILICTGEGGRGVLEAGLRERGAIVETLALYRRQAIKHPHKRFAEAIHASDAIIVSSGDALQAMWAQSRGASRRRLPKLQLVTPSARVLEQAKQLGFEQVRAPQSVSDENLIDCLQRSADPDPTINMNQESDVSAQALPEEPAPLPAPAAKSSRLSPILAALTWLLLASAMGAMGWFLWQEQQRMRHTLDQQDNSRSRFDTRVKALETELAEIRARQDEVLRVSDRSSGELNAALARIEEGHALISRLSQQLSGGRSRFQLQSIEHLLLLAHERLLLTGDTRAAAAALQTADDRLADLADPSLFKVREALTNERTALLAVEQADLGSASLSLGSLIERVPNLPLRAEAPSRFQTAGLRKAPQLETSPAAWQRMWVSVREALSGMFTIRRDEQQALLRLPGPEQETITYQVLNLRLEGARASLIAKDQTAYSESLRATQSWLEQHFRADDPGVRAMLEEVTRLESLQLRPTLPDVGRGLKLLRQRLAEDAP